jgi:LuxR family maltose regulon positive regulatory protein
MRTALLNTKLYIPAPHAQRVTRGHLLARLNAGLRQGARLTLVSAPAGYGKTTLVAEWIADLGMSSCWLSLDEHDNDPIRFWTYVVTALQKAQADVGATLLAMLRASPPPPSDVMMTTLLNDLHAADTPLLLIFDDYHLIHTSTIHEALAFLIEYLLPQMHLVLITRVDPPLNLARLRVRRQMTEVRAADLRFTADEVALFVNTVMGLALTEANIAALETRTEGWIAGLQVAAMALQGRRDVDGFIAAFTGSHRHILSYLIEEVFQRQPESIQTFLLRTAILDRLTGDLCDAVTDATDGQDTLAALEAANVFVIPLDDVGLWYRYHHLFSDVLRVRLQRDYPAAEIQALHRAAGDWYEQHGQINETVQHALHGADSAHAAALILRYADPLFKRSELATLQRWLDALPETQVRTSPQLSMLAAWVLLASNQLEAVEPRLQDVERALDLPAAPQPHIASLSAAQRGALGEVLCIRANLAFHHTDLPRVLALSHLARECLSADVKTGLFNTLPVLQGVIAFNMALAHEFSGDVGLAGEQFAQAIAFSRPIENPHLIMMSFSHLAQMQRIQGHLSQALETCTQAVRFAQESTLPPTPFQGMVDIGLGEVAYARNALAQARAHFQQGITLAQPWSNWETLVAAHLGLARVAAALGEWGAATQELDRLTARLPALQSPWGLPLIQAHQAQLALQRGDLESAAAWVYHTDLTADGDLSYVREPELIILARILAALGRLDEAARLFARLLAATEAGERCGRVIEVLVGQSLVLEAAGQHATAKRALTRALLLAEPEGYVRVFTDAGEALVPLLAEVDILPVYVARLRATFQGAISQESRHNTAVAVSQATLIEPLSDRELEVLPLIAEGLTNQEIADTLTVSLNTVKTHMRSIFGKLAARNRTEATLCARKLGLL